eukprot:1877392-Heterocapsa_arctica.AAC.1
MDYISKRDKEEGNLPLIVVRDHKSRTTLTHALPGKGNNKYAIKQIAADIEDLGHVRMIFKSDQERSILVLKDS